MRKLMLCTVDGVARAFTQRQEVGRRRENAASVGREGHGIVDHGIEKPTKKRHSPEEEGQCIFEQQEEKRSQDTDFEFMFRFWLKISLSLIHI